MTNPIRNQSVDFCCFLGEHLFLGRGNWEAVASLSGESHVGYEADYKFLITQKSVFVLYAAEEVYFSNPKKRRM